MTDIYADNMKPNVLVESLRVKVILPRGGAALIKDTAWAALSIDIATSAPPYQANLVDWYWFGIRMQGKSGPRSMFHLQQEVLQWLMEWELIELRAISSEDSEYFATVTLMDMVNP